MATVSQAPYGFVSSKTARGPDPVLVRDQLQILQDLYRTEGPALFSEHYLWILRKNPEKGERDVLANQGAQWNRRLVPFRHNRIQLDLDAHMGQRNIMLKPRQGGYTTYVILMRLLVPAILEPGTGGLLISQNSKYAAAHFSILKRAYKLFGVVDPYNQWKNAWSISLHENLLHTAYSNRHELIFDQLDSRILCESAENEEAGQGLTIQHLHASEVSRWPHNPEETLSNVKEAIPADGTVDIECTPNGMGGYFFEECMRARDGRLFGNPCEFKYFFHEWWWHDEYRKDPPLKESELTEEEKDLYEKEVGMFGKFRLDLTQLAWRRNKVMESRHNFKEKYPEDDITCFLLSGAAYFDTEILGTRLRELQSFVPYDTFPKVRIFHKRVKGRRYIIGGDSATGRQVSTDNPDWSYATVLDLETGQQMASYMARVSPEEFAWDLAELGQLYNNAEICIERTGDGGAVMLTLEVMCNYTNLYKHKEWWKRERKVVEVLGFPTSPKTRPIALRRVQFFINNSPELIYDAEFVKQCLTFVYDEKGKPAAQEGAHDDAVSAMWVVTYCRLVRLGYLDPLGVPGERYRESEDSEDSADI